MVGRITTVAFQGINPVKIDVQVQISNGNQYYQIVGLPDKAVSEAKERVRSAFSSLGISFPAKRIVINLSPVLRKYTELPNYATKGA